MCHLGRGLVNKKKIMNQGDLGHVATVSVWEADTEKVVEREKVLCEH
jgi:hypothetical protein